MRYRILWTLPLIAWLYAGSFARLFAQWIHDPNFSHGIFVPAFALFVLWRERKKLRAIEPAPSWAGLPLVMLGLLALFLGVRGVDLFLPRVSLLIVLAGLIILFQGLPFFRAVLFPWAFLILMIPIPSIILQYLTHPLQLLASQFATGLLGIVGVPAMRQGNVVVLPSTLLYVTEVDSGIRSLLSLVTLAIMYGYLMEKRNWVRVLLACSAVPIAVVASSLRIVGTGLMVQYWDPGTGEGFFHVFQGWLIFLLSMIMLFVLHRLIIFIGKTRPKSEVTPLHQTEPSRNS